MIDRVFDWCDAHPALVIAFVAFLPTFFVGPPFIG